MSQRPARGWFLFAVLTLGPVALAQPAFAAAQVTGSATISLNVQNHKSSGSDGYTDSTASNGKVYSYKYSGGGGKGGDVTFPKRGLVTVVLHLGGSGFTIDTVTFPIDPNHQLSIPNPKAPTTATIQDKNTVVQTATYKVTAKETSTGATVPCDPMIINK